MKRHTFVRAALAFLAVALAAPAQALAADTVYIALLLGSNRYQGDEGLDNLEYADDDVLRFLQTIRPLVHPEHIRVALEPDDSVRAGLALSGIDHWDRPDTQSFIDATRWIEETTQTIRHNQGPATEVRVLLYVSAHGDAFGVHLTDGVLSSPALQAHVGQLSADSVLLIADACFSSSWLVLKGHDPQAAAPPAFPLDEVADAVRDLERVGMVAAQSGTREERGLVRGGLLTHVVASALMGAADLDQDGQIHYPELSAYLDTYGEGSDALHQVRVQAPRKSNERPPVLVDLAHLGGSGLTFPPSEVEGDERFWVTDHRGRLVAELCKPGKEARQLRLASGTYRVQRFDPPDAWYGREGDVRVAAGFTTVRSEQLGGWWVWTGGKGVGDAVVPADARPLTDEEAGYRVMSPVRRSVSWRQLPGRFQGSLRVGASTLGAAQVGAPSIYPPSALSQERPFSVASVVLDARLLAIKRGYLALGGEFGVGLSPHNEVGGLDDISVWRLAYRLRLGWERPVGLVRPRLTLAGGFMSAGPRGAELSAYRLVALPTLRAEASVAWRPADGPIQLTAGLGPEWVAEPHALEGGVSLIPFRSMQAFVGLGW